MKIFNLDIELTKRNIEIGASDLAAIVFFILYTVIYGPLIKKAGGKYSECVSVEKRVHEARRLIESAGKAYGDMVLMTEKESAVAISDLTNHGNKMGVNFISITPGDIAKEPGFKYKILPIEIVVEAKDEKLAAFMGSLDELKRNIIKIKNFDIVPDKFDRTYLRAKFTLEVYLSARDFGR